MEIAKRFLTVVSMVVFSLSAIAADDSDQRTISVSGEAEIKVTPDEVILVLGVQTNDMDMNVAKAENDRRVEAILKIARDEQIPEKYLQTDRVKVDPRYDVYNDRRTFLGYWVIKTITIKLKDTMITQFDQLLTSVLSAGATHVYDTQFRTTELRKYRDQARSMAIKAAQEKARALAKDLGQSVGKARTINEGYDGWQSWYSYRGRQSRAMTQNVMQVAGGPAEVEDGIALGQISVTATISVVFDLE